MMTMIGKIITRKTMTKSRLFLRFIIIKITLIFELSFMIYENENMRMRMTTFNIIVIKRVLMTKIFLISIVTVLTIVHVQ